MEQTFVKNEKLTRSIHNVTDDTDDVYPVVTEFIDSTIAKYEGE